jgi:hypothetical protein
VRVNYVSCGCFLGEFSVSSEAVPGLKRDKSRDTGKEATLRTTHAGFLVILSDADSAGVSIVTGFFLPLLLPAVKTSSPLSSTILLLLLLIIIIITFIVIAVNGYHDQGIWNVCFLSWSMIFRSCSSS